MVEDTCYLGMRRLSMLAEIDSSKADLLLWEDVSSHERRGCDVGFDF